MITPARLGSEAVRPPPRAAGAGRRLIALEVGGPLDLVALEAALASLVRRHDVLAAAPFGGLVVRSMRSGAEITPEALADAAGPSAGGDPFVTVLLRAPNRAVLVLAIDAALADHDSAGVLAASLARRYAAETGVGERADDALEPRFDEALARRRPVSDDEREDLRYFWISRLKSLPEPPRFPGERRRTDAPFRPGLVAVSYGAGLTSALQACAERWGVALADVIFAAWAVLQRRYAGETVVAFRTPGERDDPDFAGGVGPLAPEVVVTLAVRRGDRLFEVVQRLARERRKALRHQQYFVLEGAFAGRWPSLALHEDGTRFAAGPTVFEPLLPPVRFEAGALGIGLRLAGAVSACMSYDAAAFSSAAAAAIVSHAGVVLEELVREGDAPVGRIPYLTGEERARMVRPGAANFRARSPGTTLIDLFEDQVRLRPDAVAVSHGARHCTFRYVDRAANRLARRLERRAAAGRPVGIALDASVEQIVAVVAALKLGVPYVPIDATDPPERIVGLVRRAGCGAVITGERLHGTEFAGVARLDIVREAAAIAAESSRGPSAPRDPQQIAYVMYTSGSTGEPKGCELPHEGVLNRLDWMWAHFGFTPDDVVLQKTSCGFDVSVWEMLLPLCFGARLHLLDQHLRYTPSAIARAVDEGGVTALHFVPSVLDVFLRSVTPEMRAQLRSLALVVASGEALLPSLADLHANVLGGVALHNLYGPTEASIDVTAFEASAGLAIVPIGAPIANTSVYVLDEDLGLAACDVRGELHIGGIALAQGYRHDPGLTASRFVPDPYRAGTRMYKTGDLGVVDEHGDLVFLRRADDQIKLRGRRIELAEVEAAVRRYPAVREARVYFDPAAEVLRCVVSLSDDVPVAARLVRLALTRPETFARAEILPNGLTMIGASPGETAFLYAEIFERACYLQGGIDIGPGDVVVDAGANVGAFSVFAARRGCRVVALEPVRPVYELLAANAWLYGEDRIEAVNAGLSDRPRTLPIAYYPANTIVSTARKAPAAVEEAVREHVSRDAAERGLSNEDLAELLASATRRHMLEAEFVTLSDLIRTKGLSEIGLLKLDVEGAELDALHGVADEDWPRIRQVAAEAETALAAPLAELLRDKGFTVTVDDRGSGGGFCYVYAHRGETFATAQRSAPEGEPCNLRDLETRLRAACADVLPAAAAPASFNALCAFPLTTSGKIDRSKLASAESVDLVRVTDTLRPRDRTEATLHELWCRTLRVPAVGVRESFFQAGGHSLRALELAHAIQRAFAIDVRVDDVFDHPTIEEQAALIASRTATATPLAREPQRAETHDVSLLQRALWFAGAVAPGAYVIVGAYTWSGPLDTGVLRASLDVLAERHEALRTVFLTEDGSPRARVLPDAQIPLDVADLSRVPGNDEMVRAMLAAEPAPLDPATGPLMRALLILLGEQRFVLKFSLSHLIADAVSVGVLARELVACYVRLIEHEPLDLPPVGARYRDFVAWERTALAGAAMEEHRSYWARELGSFARRTGHAEPGDAAVRARIVRRALGDETVRNLRRSAEHAGVSEFVALLACVSAVALRRSGAAEELFGIPVSVRERTEFGDQVGLYVNTVPVRVAAPRGASWRAHVDAVARSFRGAHRHRGLPLTEIVKSAPGLRGAPSTFDAFVTLQDDELSALPAGIPGVRLAKLEPPPAAPKAPLVFNFVRRAESLDCMVEYDPRRCTEEEAAELAGAVCAAIDDLAEACSGGTFASAAAFSRGAGVPSAASAAAEVPPRGGAARPTDRDEALETALVQLWRDLLQDPQVTSESEFFESGGHSLIAARLQSRALQAFGVELPLSEIMAGGTPREMALAITRRRPAPDPGGAEPGEGAPGGSGVSPGQAEIWIASRLPGGSEAFTMTIALAFDHAIDATAMCRALDEIVARHESLRTSFSAEHGEPRARVAERAAFPVAVTEEEATRPFELERGPLCRAMIAARERGSLLLLSVHHIVCDGLSLEVVARELSESYEAYRDARTPALPPAPQFRELLNEQAAFARSPEGTRHQAWWRERLMRGIVPTRLPGGAGNASAVSFAGRTWRGELGPRTSDALRALARSCSATLFEVLLAALGALLHRVTASPEIVVGGAVSGRPPGRCESAVGLFATVVPFRLAVASSDTFTTVVDAAKSAAREVLDHQRGWPAEDEAAIGPFAITFSFVRRSEGTRAALARIGAQIVETPRAVAISDLSFIAIEEPERLRLEIEYRPSAHDAETIAFLGRALLSLAEQIVADPGVPVGGIAFASITDEVRS